MTTYRRTETLDVLTVAGEAIVLLPTGRALRLSSPIAVAVHAAAAEPISSDRLADIIATDFGPPPAGDTAEALQPILDHLVDAGALTATEGVVTAQTPAEQPERNPLKGIGTPQVPGAVRRQ